MRPSRRCASGWTTTTRPRQPRTSCSICSARSTRRSATALRAARSSTTTRFSGTPVVSVSDFVIDEQTKEASFAITLDRPSTGVVSLNYATQNGTALAGSGLCSVERLAELRGWRGHEDRQGQHDQRQRCGIGRDVQSRAERLVNATSLDPTGTVTIAGNDTTAVSSPVVSVGDAIVDESQTYAEFVVRLSAPSASNVSVSYNEGSESASNGTDYMSLGTATLNFAPGETAKVVRIGLLDDTTAEGPQSSSSISSARSTRRSATPRRSRRSSTTTASRACRWSRSAMRPSTSRAAWRASR